MNNHNVEKWTLEDGRKAEKRISETVNHADLTSEKVVELHMEDERPLKLKQRIIEKTKPVIYERKIETVDVHGNVVEVKVESAEPKVPMQLVEHIGLASHHVAAQGCKKACHPKGLTKEDLAEAIVSAMKASQNDCKLKSMGVADEIANRVNAESSDNSTNYILYGIIAVLTFGLGYLLFAM